MDDGDNDPVRFLIYLISAIQKVFPGVGQSILAALNTSQFPPLLDLVEILNNEISCAAQPFLIVLDDYHLIKKVDVHTVLQFLLKCQPEYLHLVIITREDPPFSLPRIRVQGLLTEIRESDLRFTLMLNAGNFLGSVADIFYQARLTFYRGHPERAEIICQQWKQKFAGLAGFSGMGDGQSSPEIPAARGLDVVESILMLERGQIEDAELLLVKSLELPGWGSWMELHGFIELARLRHALGNESGAQ